MSSQFGETLVDLVQAHCLSKRGVCKNDKGVTTYRFMSSWDEPIIVYLRAEETPARLTVRCRDAEVNRWRNQPSIQMSDWEVPEGKWKWIDVVLDQGISLNDVIHLVDMSYEICYDQLSEHDKGFLAIIDHPMSMGEAIAEFTRLNMLQHRTAEIEALIRPSLMLRTSACSEDDIAIGQTKIGGLPDLPKDVNYPTFGDKPLVFLAQINLSEIPSSIRPVVLPEVGMIYFFSFHGYVGEDFWSDEQEEAPDFSKVIHYTGSQDTLVRASQSDAIKVCKAACVEFVLMPSLPRGGSSWMRETRDPQVVALGWTEEEYERLDQLYFDFNWIASQVIDGPNHKLFGFADSIQKAVTTAGRRLLCQIDSDYRNLDTDMMWGDGGTIYFVISHDDFARLDFSRVTAHLQSG